MKPPDSAARAIQCASIRPSMSFIGYRGIIDQETVDATTLGKLATHDVLKTTHLTKTAPIFTFSQLCNCVLSNGAYFAFLLPCNSVLVQRRLDAKLTNSNTDKGLLR